MNAIAHPAPPARRIRAGLAALVTVLLVAAGVVTATPASAATGTVTPTVSSATTSGLTIQVSASGLPDVPSVYAALIVKGTEAGVGMGGGYAAFALPFPAVTEGSASFSLTAAAADLDRSEEYEVLIWEQHTNPDESTIYARGDVSITSAQWDAVFPPPPPPAPSVNATVTAASETGLTVSVTASDLPAVSSVYAALIVKDGEAGVGMGGGYAAFALPFPAVTAGSAAFDLAAAAADLDRSEVYEVLIWQQHTNPDESTIYARGNVSITSAQWDAVFGPEPVAPVLTVTPNTNLDAEGDTVTVTGSGYNPDQPIYVFLCADIELPADLWTHALGCQSDSKVIYGQSDTNPSRVKFDADGSFEVEFSVKQLAGGATSVFTAANHTAQTDRTQDAKAVLAFATAPTGPMLTVTPNTGLNAEGDTVTVTGSGYNPDQPIYVFLCADLELPANLWTHALACQSESKVIYGQSDTNPSRVKFDADGSFEVEFSVKQLNEGATAVFTAANHTAQTDRTQDAKAVLAFAAVTTPEPPAPPVPGGSLRWAISSSFVTYVTGPIANGSVTVSGGATQSGGLFQFGQGSSTYNVETGVGTVNYVGAVRFTGHDGQLDVTISSPQISVASATSATLSVLSGGSRVVLANLNLAAATKSISNGAVTYTAAPASLTTAGLNQVFEGNQPSGGLNPVTFTIGSASSAPAGSTGVVASAPQTDDDGIPSTPPASTGIDLDDDAREAINDGEDFTISADGFEPNESGIKVVVYSTPVLLGTVQADSAGVATWTGRLPADLADGEHTITMQGSVDRGATFTLARAVMMAVGTCSIDSATLNWGFKESFRVYIEGIAKGGWNLSDIEYDFPEFVWSDATGSLDAETATGVIAFPGELNFHGHDGALDTTLSNARVELAGDRGYLVFDVQGETQGGTAVNITNVRFAEFATGDATVVDGELTLDAVAATLTADGAGAFGTYPAGEQMDPVTFIVSMDVACADTAEEPTSTEPTPEADDASGVPLWVWLIGGLLLLAIVITLVIVAARKRV